MSATASTPPPVHDPPAPAGRPPGTARVRVVMLLTFLAVSLLGTLVVLFVENNRLQGRHKQAGDITARFAYTIHDHLNRSLSATYALATLIRQGHGRIDHFEQLGNEMLSLYGGIDSLQLVPDGIIRQIAPLRGNEKALGLNLFADTVRSDEALLAVKTRRLSLAGPAELIQGGQAVVGRLPVFLNRADGSEYLWGLVAVVIRIPDLLDAARLEQGVESGYDYELSRIRPDTGRPEVFARSSGTPLRSPVRYTIDVPNGSWILGLQPRAGWRSWPAIAGESVLVLFIGALVASMLGTLYKQPLVLQRMVDERTGQLSEANQKLTYEIRERERAEEALRSNEERLQLVLEGSNDGFLDWDIEAGSVNLSCRLFEMLGYAPGEIRPTIRAVFELIHPDDKQRVRTVMYDQLSRTSSPFGVELRMITKGNEFEWVCFRGKVVSRDENGIPSRVSGIISNITEKKRSEESLQYISMHDPLTGLFNRGYFETEMSRMEQSRQYPVSIVLADIDGLKAVNDRFGHTEGDRLIKQASQVLRQSFRAEDVIARIGGDEFAVILHLADAHTVKDALKRVRTCQSLLNEGNGDFPLSVSLGAATAERNEQLHDAFKLADSRMYRHKSRQKLRRLRSVEERRG